MSLQEEIEAKSSQIRTDSYAMSVGELMSLYKDGELDVHPEFQRIYRWSDTQKTKLIESMLLGIPLPPIFVAQQPDGVWDVVDGVQRLSTIFQFVGILKDDTGVLVSPLVLEKTKYLPSLEGKKWHDRYDSNDSFTQGQQLYLKRAKLDMNIVLKESDPQSKYELFMRINTGGSDLSGQEVRNCLLLMTDKPTYYWLKSLSEEANFLTCCALSDRAMNEKYHMELALRFLVFRTLPVADFKGIGDIGTFLDDQLQSVINKEPRQRDEDEGAFKETFRLLADELGDDAFRRYDVNKKRFAGGFLISAFEAVALGLGFNFHVTSKLSQVSLLKDKVMKLWENPDFAENSGSGVRGSTRIPKIIPLGRSLFK